MLKPVVKYWQVVWLKNGNSGQLDSFSDSNSKINQCQTMTTTATTAIKYEDLFLSMKKIYSILTVSHFKGREMVGKSFTVMVCSAPWWCLVHATIMRRFEIWA